MNVALLFPLVQNILTNFRWHVWLNAVFGEAGITFSQKPIDPMLYGVYSYWIYQQLSFEWQEWLKPVIGMFVWGCEEGGGWRHLWRNRYMLFSEYDSLVALVVTTPMDTVHIHARIPKHIITSNRLSEKPLIEAAGLFMVNSVLAIILHR